MVTFETKAPSTTLNITVNDYISANIASNHENVYSSFKINGYDRNTVIDRPTTSTIIKLEHINNTKIFQLSRELCQYIFDPKELIYIIPEIKNMIGENDLFFNTDLNLLIIFKHLLSNYSTQMNEIDDINLENENLTEEVKNILLSYVEGLIDTQNPNFQNFYSEHYDG